MIAYMILTMKREYLREYEAKEIELQREYYRKVLADPGKESSMKNPFESRFKKINEPIVVCDSKCYEQYGEKIWSQIPFAGTLIIPLGVSTSQNFLRLHGFDIEDIQKLVEFSKDTGRVAFSLNTNPIRYEGLDYLEPIFSELQPPLLTTPAELYTDDASYDKWQREFHDLAIPTYYHHLIHEIEEMGETANYFHTLKSFRASAYLRLRLLNLNEVIDEINNYVNAIPEYVSWLLEYYAFATQHLFNPLWANQNYTLESLEFYGKMPQRSPKQQLPVEIGSYIMKKIAPSPQTYYGCVSVIEYYKQNELYKALESLIKR
jgi:hypothetical protein